MPKLERWDKLPEGVRLHLIERMRDRHISIPDLNELRKWVETQPEVPEGDWFKDFGSFKICGNGPFPKSFLLRRQIEKGDPFSSLHNPASLEISSTPEALSAGTQ